MSIKSFDAGEFFNDGERFSHGALIHLHDARAALELIGPKSGKGSSRPTCRQRVARACQEIANRYR